MKILKSKMANIIYSPGSYWFISRRKFLDGEINHLITIIKIGKSKKYHRLTTNLFAD